MGVRVVEQSISAAEANRRFSRLLRGVRDGTTYLVTSHGEPVARILPAGKRNEAASRQREALLTRLERQSVANAGAWTRDELYENDSPG